jgi:aerobic carbon-monoxide dehydrogenase large subunit
MQDGHAELGPARLEDAALVQGTGAFVGDLTRPGMVHAAFVRSYLPHGRITEVDLTEAREHDGVVAAYSAADLDLRDIPGATGRGADVPMTRPPLARDTVRYVGEPVAVVLAEDVYTAADAAEVWVELEELPVVADVDAALRDESLLFPGFATNLVTRSSAGVTRDDAEPAPDHEVTVTTTVENQRLAPSSIEPLGILCDPDFDGRITVWCGHQAPHRLRTQLAKLLELDESRLRVIVPEVGGAFGMKGMLYPEYLVVIAAALRLGRPVRWVETRTESFLGGTHGRAMRHRVTLSGDRSGRIRRADVLITADVGAYPHNGSHVPMFSRLVAGGPYDIDDLSATMEIAVTNRAPTGSYRGAGRPEAAYALERAVDDYARACGLDPAEVRRINLLRSDQMPHRTATGALYDGGDYSGALERALELADHDGVRALQAERRASGGPAVGIGIGAFVERAGGAADSEEYACVELDADGRIVVRTGSQPMGQGILTSFAYLAAQRWGVDPVDVEVVAGDTDTVADGVGSFASRSAQIGGSAIHLASGRLQARLKELASEHLEIDPEDLEFRDGAVVLRGAPERQVDLLTLRGIADDRGIDLREEEHYSPHAQTFPYGVHVAVVEVDVETGHVDLRLLAAVDDCGTQIHPQIVEGQVHGSLVQGVGQALFEGVTYEDGQLKTASFLDYTLPAAPDSPRIVTDHLVTPAPSNPLGAKGSGEPGCIGAPPAIVNAVLDALAPYGVTDLEMPLTPLRVWQAIQDAKQLDTEVVR